MTAPALKVQIQGVTTVSADNLNSFEQTCDNLTQLAALVGLPGMQVFARGISTPNDGGQGPFYWAVGVYTNDGVNVVVPTGASSGAWLRLPLNGVVPIAPLVTVSGTTIQKSQLFIPIDNTTGSAFSINLPAGPVNGETHTIKDWLGNAGTYAITVNGNGYPVDDGSNYSMNFNCQAVTMTFAYTKWGVWS